MAESQSVKSGHDTTAPPEKKGNKGTPITLAIVVIFLAVVPFIINSTYNVHILIMTFFYVIATLSLRTILISGQFPLGHAAYLGIGAYAAGMASRWLGWPPALTIPVAAIVTMVIGIIVALPFSRLRALYYAMGSMFFGVAVTQILNAGGIVTGGYSGLTGIGSMFHGNKMTWYYFALFLMIICGIAMYRFEFSRIGTNLKAISQSHMVAASVGIDERKYRILAVAIGCFFVGLSGAGYAHYMGMISTTSYNFMATMWLVMYVLVGGLNSFYGPVIGTFILVLLPEYFRELKTYSPFISAAVLLLVVYLMPDGIVGLAKYLWEKAKNRNVKKVAHAS